MINKIFNGPNMLLGIGVIAIIMCLYLTGWQTLYVPLIMLVGCVVGYITMSICERVFKIKDNE